MQKSYFYTIFFLKICDYKRTFNFSKKPHLRGFFTYFFAAGQNVFFAERQNATLGLSDEPAYFFAAGASGLNALA